MQRTAMTHPPLRIVPPDEPATPPPPDVWIVGTIRHIADDIESGKGNRLKLAEQLAGLAQELRKAQ